MIFVRHYLQILKLILKINGEKALVQSGRSRFSLITLPASDFPSLDEISSQFEIELPQNILKEIMEKTAFAMAQQDVRYYLNGLLLEVSTGQLRAVATDGHRLAYCEKAIETDISETRQVILPRKGVLELMRM